MTSKNSSILITGANRGMGRKTVDLPIEKGKEVYVCARKKKEKDELRIFMIDA